MANKPKAKWYRLDNSGMIYPMVITLRTQSLYRIGVELKEKVDPSYLRIAVNSALERFPYFKVELKRGLFRHYLDENNRAPLVEEDDGVLLKILNFRHNRYYLFRTTYYENKIFIDFFHGLCDGTGALEFFKSVLYYYFKAANDPFPRENVMTISKKQREEETEDAFKKYYKKIELGKGISKMAAGSAYRPNGKQFHYEGFGLIQAEVSTDKLLEAARRHGCSVTVYIAALAMYSVALCADVKDVKEDFVAFIPVNLRKKFPSGTMFNFTNFAKCPVPKETERTFDDFIAVLKEKLASQLTEEELQIKLSFSSLMDKLPLLRYMPLFLKGFISRIGREISPKSKQTMIISNLGNVKLEDGKRIRNFFFDLNCNERTPINLGVISYNGVTTLSFTRKLIGTDIEKNFCRMLSEECGEVKVVSNFREENDVL